jgi:hypothetical protein
VSIPFRLMPRLLPLLIGACRDGAAPVPREVGIVDHYGERSVLSLPSTIRAGLDFEVSLQTFGGGCLTAAGSGVRYHAMSATITPYDNNEARVGEGIGCPDILRRATHIVVLRFPLSGAATIRIEGRQEPGGRRVVLDSIVSVVPLVP